jgi:hypothetical protein
MRYSFYLLLWCVNLIVMYEIAYETKELGFWKILATWSETFKSYVDQEGFLLSVDNALWIEKV